MIKVKRSYAYDKKLGIIVWIGMFIVFLLIALVSRKSSNDLLRRFGEFFALDIVELSILVISMYPFAVLYRLTPLFLRRNGGGAVRVLPYTNKQLFWMETKKWFFFMSVAIIATSILGALYNGEMLKDNFHNIFLYELALNIFKCSAIIVGGMGIISVIIISLAKALEWYKVLILYIISNSIAIWLVGCGVYLFNIDTSNSPIAVLLLFGSLAFVNIVFFIVSWRNLENINK